MLRCILISAIMLAFKQRKPNEQKKKKQQKSQWARNIRKEA